MKKLLTVLLLNFMLIIAGCQNLNSTSTLEVDIEIDLVTKTITSNLDTTINLSVLDKSFLVEFDIPETNTDDSILITLNGKEIQDDHFEQADSKISFEFYADFILDEDTQLPIEVTLQPNGGLFHKDFSDFIEPFKTLEINFYDDLDTKELTIMTPKENGLRWHYKAFLKYIQAIDGYEIVFADLQTASVDHLNLPDYDLILALHYHNPSIETDLNLKYLFSEDALGDIIFIHDFDSHMVLAVYQKDIINSPMTFILQEDFILPDIFKDEFTFGGWFDGDNIAHELTLPTAKDHLNKRTLQALWEGAGVDAINQFLDTLIPSFISKDLYLPTTYSSYTITWQSSHPNIISSEGIFQTSYSAKKVELTALVTDPNDFEYEKTFEVDVLFKKKLSKPIASGYIYRNYDVIVDELFDYLDLINIAFITADKDGNLTAPAVLSNTEKYIFPHTKTHGNWVLISIAPSSAWSQLVLSETAMVAFADNIVKMINDYGFDGVDLDWETPTSSERTLFTKLSKLVYEKVKENNANHLVTAAITGGIYQPPQYDLTNSGQYLDYINVMTYSMASSAGSYQNPLFKSSTFHHQTFKVGRSAATATIDESVPIFNSYGIPNEKLIFGLAFYGVKQTRSFNNQTQSWSNWVSGGSVYYDELIAKYLSNDQYDKMFDEIAKVPYIIKQDGTEFISYDNPQSIDEKGKYIIKNGLGGLMFWEYGTDPTGTLLQAMAESLNKD